MSLGPTRDFTNDNLARIHEPGDSARLGGQNSTGQDEENESRARHHREHESHCDTQNCRHDQNYALYRAVAIFLLLPPLVTVSETMTWPPAAQLAPVLAELEMCGGAHLLPDPQTSGSVRAATHILGTRSLRRPVKTPSPARGGTGTLDATLNPTTAMNTTHKTTLFALALALLSTAFLTGCNTMRGLGKDTERAGEKIQEKASR
jgi:entericidin A